MTIPANLVRRQIIATNPNLFARQTRIHLIKLPETIALHAYATTIQN
jgi:hypothetical protein